MQVSDLQHLHAEVVAIQSSYFILKIEDKIIRFDFVKKQNSQLNVGDIGFLEHIAAHSYLSWCNEPLCEVYIAQKTNDADAICSKIKITIDALTQQQVDWQDYIIEKSPTLLANNLNKGMGLLVRAPLSIAEKIVDLCNENNIKTSFLTNSITKHQYKMLKIGNSFVVAADFKIQIKR
jgi:hypothetical protein